MELEIEYVNHCDACDLGYAIYTCVKCAKVNIDYGDLWWNRESDINVNVKCENCEQEFLLIRKGKKYAIITKHVIEPKENKKMPQLSPNMLVLTNKNETDCEELKSFFNEMSFEIDELFIREFLCHKIEIKDNLIMLTPKTSKKSYYLIVIVGNDMYYTLLESEKSKPSFQNWATFENDMTSYYVGELKLLMTLEKIEVPMPPMFPPEITVKNYRM